MQCASSVHQEKDKMSIKIRRTNSENKDFIQLIKELDAYLKITDEDEHDFYNQFHNTDVLKNIVVIYVDEIAVGCGAIKKFDETSVEIKRMFVALDKRGSGVAQKNAARIRNVCKRISVSKVRIRNRSASS